MMFLLWRISSYIHLVVTTHMFVSPQVVQQTSKCGNAVLDLELLVWRHCWTRGHKKKLKKARKFFFKTTGQEYDNMAVCQNSCSPQSRRVSHNKIIPLWCEIHVHANYFKRWDFSHALLLGQCRPQALLQFLFVGDSRPKGIIPVTDRSDVQAWVERRLEF